MTHHGAVSTMAAERYLLDEMAEIERMAFEAHYFECPDCAADVHAGELMRAAAIAQREARHGTQPVAASEPETPAFVPSTQAAHAPARSSRWSTVVVPWAAAAALALFAGYQTLFTIPASRRTASIEALEPITLRPASRGADAVVTIRSGQTQVLLDLDLGAAASGPEIEYDLKADDGASVVERARTPAPGAPLLLLVPAGRLQAAHRFTIVVRDPSNADSPLGEYRFTVTSDTGS